MIRLLVAMLIGWLIYENDLWDELFYVSVYIAIGLSIMLIYKFIKEVKLW